jgi:hypothetical protein
LPSDPDGSSSVAPGSPNYMIAKRATSLAMYKFKANFANSALTTFTGPTLIPVAAYTELCSATGTCVTQPGTTTQLDSLGDRLSSRLSYRRYADGRVSLVTSHAVSTGLRWYEIRNPDAAAPVIFQQGTFAPSSTTRWLGAMAQDKNGNFGIADTAGLLGPETTIIAGTGVQNAGLTRWGDYASMTVDPVDNCTFWFTSEYMKTNGSFNWNTRVASIKLAGCN